MKQRVLVMNGQRLVQSEDKGAWQTDKVDRAGELKPGIYNIYNAQPADKAKSHTGAILNVEDGHVFQQVDHAAYVKHKASDFDKVPAVGSSKTITYEKGRAIVNAPAQQHGRGHSR